MVDSCDPNWNNILVCIFNTYDSYCMYYFYVIYTYCKLFPNHCLENKKNTLRNALNQNISNQNIFLYFEDGMWNPNCNAFKRYQMHLSAYKDAFKFASSYFAYTCMYLNI